MSRSELRREVRNQAENSGRREIEGKVRRCGDIGHEGDSMDARRAMARMTTVGMIMLEWKKNRNQKKATYEDRKLSFESPFLMSNHGLNSPMPGHLRAQILSRLTPKQNM
ncbi:MAG: hypothetical protein V1784_06870 [bacterium]